MAERFVMSSKVLTPVPTTQGSWIRALFLLIPGWTHHQVSTMVDQYTKGDEVITMVWGTSQLLQVGATKGGKVTMQVEGQQAQKLQKAQLQGFKHKDGLTSLTSTWKVTKAQKVELTKLAAGTFKVMEVAS